MGAPWRRYFCMLLDEVKAAKLNSKVGERTLAPQSSSRRRFCIGTGTESRGRQLQPQRLVDLDEMRVPRTEFLQGWFVQRNVASAPAAV